MSSSVNLGNLISYILTLVVFAYTVYRNRSQDFEKFEHRLDALEKSTVVIETKLQVFWTNVKFDAASILHSPDPAKWRTDYLIDQHKAGKLTEAEQVELEEILSCWLADHDLVAGERLAAALLLRALEADRHVAEVTKAIEALRVDKGKKTRGLIL